MDYKQSTISGTTYTRFGGIDIHNPLGQQPSVRCSEQSVILTTGDPVVREVNILHFPFNATETFDILDPTTNTSTGATATGAQVYALVYSYVLHEALKRDAAVAAAVPRGPDQATPLP